MGTRVGAADVSQPAPPDSPFWPDWLVDGSQVFGAFASAIALGLAAFAIYRAETVASRERRLAHDLEVLRGMTDIRLMSNGRLQLESANELLAALIKLRTFRDFPLTRVACGLPSTREAVAEFVRLYPHAPSITADGTLPVERIGAVQQDGTYAVEWNDALERRIISRRRRWWRTNGWLSGPEQDAYERRLREAAAPPPPRRPPGPDRATGS